MATGDDGAAAVDALPPEILDHLRARVEPLAARCGVEREAVGDVLMASAEDLAREASLLLFIPIFAERRTRSRLLGGSAHPAETIP